MRLVGVKVDKDKKGYFNSDGFELSIGDLVVVESNDGLDCGEVVVSSSDLDFSKEDEARFKKVLRVANSSDRDIYNYSKNHRDEVLAKCKEIIEEHKLNMKLLDLKYTYKDKKLVFYYTAPERVDFRQLVKELAHEFKLRIELRQVRDREEGKHIGGIGNCGKELCCCKWKDNFETVSIKMVAKQNISLNQTKISGLCGKLMCCLKYEDDMYTELRKGLPNNGDIVVVHGKEALVRSVNILQGTIKAALIVSKNEQGIETEPELKVYDREDISSIQKSKSN